MEDFIPSVSETVKNLIITGVCGLLGILWSKYIRGINVQRLPKWLIAGLSIYAFITLIIFAYNFFERHRPLEIHKNEKFDHQSVVLDGKSFEGCVFDNVKFVYKGTRKGRFYDNNRLNNVEFLFEGRASIGFLFISEMKKSPELAPTANKFLIDMLNNRAVDYSDMENREIEDF